MKTLKVLISGGGTGGHIFPAISIANEIKSLRPDAEILFIGALGRMEMHRVPEAGYEIKGLPVAGFDRAHLLKNAKVVWKLFKSRRLAKRYIKEFQPDVAVGVGGYASGPALNVAHKMGVPIVIQEQNSYAGVTNKLLSKSASAICVAYEGMERFFPADRIVMTGNPVRQNLLTDAPSREEAAKALNLDPEKKIVLVVGGSLGARTMNESILGHLEFIAANEVEVLWQTGKYYRYEIAKRLMGLGCPRNLHVCDFISDMPQAYAAADLVISRAGAGTISELCLLGKPTILVPSPNVAEDHQTKNAMALVEKNAALMVKDDEAKEKLVDLAMETVEDDAKLASLATEIKKLALPNAANDIAKIVLSKIKNLE